MIKISALNEESSEESEDEDVPTITKEAQEQIALTEYNKALVLLKENKQEDALNIFKDLLETELLDEVEKPDVSDGRSRPMLLLKYSCFKNIAAIRTATGHYDEAIENYWEAANLDDTDVTLWYRIGTLAMKTSNLELACSSFKQGLKCNSNHWPCLDDMITALYAVPDYMNCLLYISMALERDPTYVKGLAFRDRIFKDIPCLQECYKLYNSDWQLDPPLYTEYDHMVGDKLLAEAKDVATRWAETCKIEFNPKPLPDLTLRKPIKSCTWLDVGESLLDIHRYITENDLSFVSRINLTILNPEEILLKVNNEDDTQVNNGTNTNQDVLQNISVKKENDTEKLLKMDTDEVNFPFESMDDNQMCDGGDTVMEVEEEDDKKSCSSDVQIIEDEDPLRISDTEQGISEQNQVQNESVEQNNFEIDENGEKLHSEKIMDDTSNTGNEVQNDKVSDKDSNKSSEKPYEKDLKKADKIQCKAEEKCNDKNETKEEGQKVKKRRRSALCFLQQWAWSCNSMRRSARVRSSNRREAERDDVQLEETLRRIFPSTLLPDTVKLTKDDPSKNMDDSMDTMDLYQLFANQENNSIATETIKSSESSKSPSPDTSQQQNYFGTESETADVNIFITEHSGKSNLMIIIAKYTEFLCTKWNREWPKGMSEIYLQAYTFMREHIPHPSPFEEDVNDDILKLDAEMTLLFGELHTDRWLSNKPDILPSSTLDKLGTGMPSEELGHIIFTSVRHDILNEENIFILLRVLWLKANIFLCQGDTDIVIETIELLLNHMQELEKKNRNIYLRLPNCKCNSLISIKIVEKKLRSIQRGQKLGEIQNLYDEKKYAELAYILQDTFKFAKQGNKFLSVNDNIVDRVQQLSMLLDSLWQLQQYEECYVWAEACLNEAWQNYINAFDEIEQKKWTMSVLTALEKLEACTVEVSTFILRYLPENRLSRLVQNLVHIVCNQLDVSDTTVEMPLETVLPWILLHYILQYKEDKERAKVESSYKNRQHSSNYSESDDEDEGVPASIMILFIAHEFMGRHSWCCYNEAKLLFFTLNLVIPKLETPQFVSIKSKVSKYLEQIFYCLYGHYNRVNKGRPKHLEEHGVPKMKVTWEGAQLLFEFYKPKQIPEFCSPRSLTISADTEELFKRIMKLIPSESDPSQVIDEMRAYIMSERDTMPTVKKPLPHAMSTIYYLLGDFYFKNGKWSVAIRYYLLDLCFHPSRLSSWTGLAMSSGTVIESWLNKYKPINEDKLLAKAKLTQSSYRHAVELDSCNHIIWTEYGSFAYVVHSFCSRLLKQETDTLSMERFEFLETRKEEMLEIADQCFQSCARLFIGIKDGTIRHDERWLYQYMLGKITEKKNQDPPIFLEYYAKASELLYHNNAQYPRRISHKCPQHLSVEALEVHYRIHASILKYLEQHEGKPLKKSLGQVLHLHLEKCAEGPFMKYNSKLSERGKEDGFFAGNKNTGKEVELSAEGDRNVVTVCQRSNSIEEIEIVDRTNKGFSSNQRVEKTEMRKRPLTDMPHDNVKKIKLGSVSHLQLMQDVVALIDDVITKVCVMVSQKEKGDDIMVLSSDESNESKSQRKRARTKNVEKTKLQVKSSIENKKDLTNPLKMGGANEPEEKLDNVQDLMDALMKQAMEVSQETRQSTPEDDDTRKFDGKWLQSDDLHGSNKDMKEKSGDKKKLASTTKEEVTLSRRGSQESTTTTQTTTTTTETNNSSSSSSDESSSSEDSSDSDSSSDTDSDSGESDSEKKKKDSSFAQKEENMTEEEVATLIAYCLAGLEQCILRFSEHYKSFYRLSHFFFNNKTAKDITKCRNLLLDSYNCQFYQGENFQGLFADRKSTNFFSGVWHIPNGEVDRPGSFAFHMSRCVTLLMQVLKETNDGRMLMQLSIQLGKIPESDKKYLRDTEREQLSRQALTLCLQSLRTKVQLMGPTTSDPASSKNPDARTQVLLDTYWVYQRAIKNFQTKEQTIQTLSALLVDTYKTYVGNKNLEGNILEIATKFCNDYNYNRKVLSKFFSSLDKPTTDTQAQPQAVSPTPQVVTTQPQINSTSSQSSQNRKPYKSMTSTGRPRGRPPNVNKYLQAMQQGSNTMNQFNTKANFTNYMGASGNRSLMNPYFMHPLVDPNILSAILTSGLSGSMMDPLSTMNYLNQMGSYQDILRHYQNNLSSLSNLTSGLNNTIATAPNISNVPTMSTSTPSINTTPSMSNLGNLNNLTVQQLLNLSNSTATTVRSTPMYQQAATTKTTTTTASITKDRPSISITPVNTVPPKNKPSKQSPQSDTLPIQLSKTLQISQPSKPVLQPPTTQVSLLKPSIVQHVKTSPPKQMSAPQIRVSKSLTEPQPAHNPSLSHSPLKSSTTTNSTVVPQVAHTTIGPSMGLKQTLPMNVPTPHSGTSLQHKLLSKKNSQRPYSQVNVQNPMRKMKPTKAIPTLPSSFSTLLSAMPGSSSMTQPPFIPPELSGISVSPVNPQTGLKSTGMKYTNYKKSSVKTNPPASIDTTSSLTSSFPQGSSVEALSMLSQLKQHSHLEIIPQQKAQMKPTMEYPKNLSSGVSVVPQKVSDPLRPSNTDCMTIFDLPRGKSSSVSSKKGDKTANDSVEIITDCMTIFDLPRGKSSSVSSKKGDKTANDSVEIITLDD
ncbi:calcineurin-binding protein cabin-1 isoform X1 [Colletes latitarsis]|uniref:calcineurin-binding protein cabin-1 isoform X1 n=1 Tax=Colletes latitarsis TaxID=2605962 RepID=UPI0040355365